MRVAPFLQAVRTALLVRSSSNSASNEMTTTPPIASLASMLPPLADNCRARVYLLRHGETDWNAKGLMQGGGYDIELNDKGRRQAAAVCNAELGLAGMPISVVASSNLKRASETADILHKQQFPTARRIVRKEFAEMSFGSFEGLAIRGPDATPETLEQFKSFNAVMQKDANERWPGGESTAEVALRAQQGLTQILDEVIDEHDEAPHIAIVAHGRTNKVLLASLLTGDVLQYGEIQQGNTCINVIDLDCEGAWISQAINYIDHIQGDLARE